MVQQVLRSTLENWQQVDFRKVEVSLLLVYMIGEALPVSITDIFIDEEAPFNVHSLKVPSTT